ncbi:OmpA family protein [Yoonia maritima]|uniref:OmpA family protein n=1 Tax=Yoonia maritima TaxID=1435347 RepID=UPI0037367BBF
MKVLNAALPVSILLSVSTPAIAETDKEGSSDHPLLSRYPGFYIDTYKVRDFDRAQLIVSPMIDDDYETMTAEGQVTNIEYRASDASISGFQLFANYQKALESLDAEIIFSCFGEAECGAKGNDFYNYSIRHTALFGGDRVDFMEEFGILSAKFEQYGQAAHISIVTAASRNDDRRVHQTIVSTASLDTEKIGIGTIENVTAAIEETGTVVLEGIYFESGTSDLTDLSNETLDTTGAYLAENPDLSFYIVGHTDWVGSYDFNLSLSEDRAASVVDALTERGIEEDRLTSVGIGPVAPVANNADETGRAINRRVELVLRE